MQATWNFNQWNEEEVEVRIGVGQTDGGEREAVVAEIDDQPGEAKIEEAPEQHWVLYQVNHRLSVGGHQVSWRVCVFTSEKDYSIVQDVL